MLQITGDLSVERRARAEFLKYFESLYTDDRKAGPKTAEPMKIIPSLPPLDGEVALGFDSLPRPTEASPALIRWFWEELVSFAREKQAQNEGDFMQHETFRKNLRALMFSDRGHDPFELLSPYEKFIIASEITSIRFLEDELGPPMVDAILRQIDDYPDNWLSALAEKLAACRPLQTINAADFVSTLALRAAENPQIGSRVIEVRHVLPKLEYLIKDLMRADKRPFVRIKLSAVQARLEDEPTGKTLMNPGRTSGLSDVNGLIRGKIVAVASDAVGLLDGSGRIREIAAIEPQCVSLSPDQRSVMDTTNTIRRAAACSRLEFKSVFAAVRDNGVSPFGANVDAPIMWQQIHDPLNRGMITRNVGFNIAALPRRSQGPLVEFLLKARSDAEVSRLKHAVEVQTDDDAKRNLLESFFGCAEHTEMGDIILSVAEHAESAPVFEAYAKLASSAEAIVADIMALQDQVPGKKYPREHFLRQIISKANRVMQELNNEFARGVQRAIPGKDGKMELKEFPKAEACEKAARKIYAEDEDLRNFAYLVASIQREDLAELNLETFALTKLHGPSPVEEVMKRPIGKKIREIATAQFPNDVNEFELFLKDPGAKIFYSTCGSELLGFFCMRQLPSGVLHLDWYSTNPDGVVPGLAEATLVSSIRKLEAQAKYAVVAPHVASSTTTIERLGFAAFAETDEYSQTYLRISEFGAERGRYRSKQFTPDQVEEVKALCDTQPLQLLKYETNDETFKVARVEYSDRTHNDEVSAKTDDGHVYRFLRQLNAKAGNENIHGVGGEWAMARYIPATGNTKDRQVHYCVFEQRRLPGDGVIVLGQAIRESHA